MTTSQFMEQVRVNAAMEQELARSFTQIGSIQSARVHLATPRQSVFVRERVAPKASVVITPQPGRAISANQVQAIVHLLDHPAERERLGQQARQAMVDKYDLHTVCLPQQLAWVNGLVTA